MIDFYSRLYIINTTYTNININKNKIAMKPIKNPNILITEVDKNFSVVVNLHIHDGVKVINKNQLVILNAIDGEKSIQDLSNEFCFSEDDIVSLCNIFSEKEIVNFSGVFSHPQKQTDPTSLNFWVHTSNACTLRCSYCYIHTLGGAQSMGHETIAHLVKKIVETVEIRKLKTVVLRLAGGEPFLEFKKWAPYLKDLKIQLNSLKCNCRIIFLTNLVTMDEEIIKFIREQDAGIGVSMDGLNEYQDNSRHFANGTGSFEFVSKNLKKLTENAIRPVIMTVVSNNNIDGLVELTKYFISNKLKFRYSFVQDEPIDIEKLIDTMTECYSLMENAIETEGYHFSQLHSLCDLQFSSVAFTTCGNGFSNGALYPDGDIFFCQRNFGTDTPSGSIFENQDLLSIIQRKTYYKDLPSDCESCPYRYHCMGGCPLERGNGKDPHCEVYKLFFPIYYKLYAKERLIKIKNNL